MGTGATRDLFALARQFRKRSWTNDPSDANYPNHWNTQPVLQGESVTDVIPGSATVNGHRTPVTLRVATESTGKTAYYVDTPSIEAVGPLARLAQRAAQHNGLTQPRRIDASEARVTQVGPDRLRLEAPGLAVDARTQGFVGRPAQLSAGEQLRQAWRFAKG